VIRGPSGYEFADHSISPIDSVALTTMRPPKSPEKGQVLDPRWTLEIVARSLQRIADYSAVGRGDIFRRAFEAALKGAATRANLDRLEKGAVAVVSANVGNNAPVGYPWARIGTHGGRGQVRQTAVYSGIEDSVVKDQQESIQGFSGNWRAPDSHILSLHRPSCGAQADSDWSVSVSR